MSLPPGFEIEEDVTPKGGGLPPGFEIEDAGPTQPSTLDRMSEGIQRITRPLSKVQGIADQATYMIPGIGDAYRAFNTGLDFANRGAQKAGEYVAEKGGEMFPNHPMAAAGAGTAVAMAPTIASMVVPGAMARPRLLKALRPSEGVPVAEPKVPAGATAPPEIPVLNPTKTGEPYGLFSYNDEMGADFSPRSLYTIHGDPAHPLIDVSKGGAGNTTQTADWFRERGVPIKGREPRSVGKWEPLDYPHETKAPAGGSEPASPAAPAEPEAVPSTLEKKPSRFAPLNILQRLGTKGVNSHAGITPETVHTMTRAGQNPAEIGATIGKRLVDDQVLGQSPSETFDRVSAKRQEFGQSVQKALDQIKQANRTSGEWADVEDSLHIDATKALKPLLDKKVSLANSPFSANKRMARPWTEAYTYLADQANASGGKTSLDHVNGAMKHVGEMLGKLEKGTESYKNAASLYGTLANARDAMVNDIAGRLGDPALASNLLKANQGYSFYSRIMPDISWQAATDAVGGPDMSILGTIKTEARPLLSRMAVRTGNALSKKPRILSERRPGDPRQ